MISVCMATHNGAYFIQEQLDSILMQLSSSDELVISDDCSTDQTVSIIRKYNDPRIRLINQGRSIGIASNFEAALKVSTGEHIFLADQDDVWLPAKTETMLDFLRNFDLVVSDCVVVDERMTPQFPSFYSRRGSGKGFFKNLLKNSYMGCCMAFRRNVLERSLPFPSNIPMHDQWIGMVGELNFTVAFIPNILVYHRRHFQNASSTGRPSSQTLRRQVSDRMKIVKSIFLNKYYVG